MNEQEKQTKKWYQRWWVWVIGIIFIIFIWNKVNNFIEDVTTKEIPNVMSINYTDAEKVLKENGFKVTSIETDAGSILSNDTYNRSIKKGGVFKVNNDTNPNYSYMKTKNKKVTIYYAKDDYVYEEEPEEDNMQDEITETATKEIQKNKPSYDDLEAWRQFLKDYEDWTDSYIEFMKKYKDNPTNVTLLAEYGKFAAETAKWAERAEEYEDELENGDFPPEVIEEYFSTLARITQKIAEIAY